MAQTIAWPGTPAPAPAGAGVRRGRPNLPPPQRPGDAEARRLGNIRTQQEIDEANREAARGQVAQQAEQRAAFLATRLSGAMQEIRNQASRNPRAVSPSLGAEALRTVAGDTPANYANSDERQAIESAQFDAIDAALTLGTGAAYTREQLEGYRRSMFPSLGDSPTAIAAKRRRLETMLAAARVNAGAAAPQIDAALASLSSIYGEEADAPGTAPVGEQFAAQLEGALRRGEFTTPDEMFAYVERLNPTVASRLNPETRAEMADVLARFNEARRRNPNAAIDVDAPGEPAADISAVRGEGANPNALMLNEAVRNADSMLGPLFRAATGLLGAEGGDAFHRGFIDVPTLGLSDEAGAAIGAGLGAGDFDANLARERAINEYDHQNNFGARLGGQLIGGLTLPFNPAAGLGRTVATSAAFGGAYGFGSGEGADRIPSAFVGAGIGAAAPPALRAAGSTVNAVLGRGVREVTPEAAAIARAADEEGVQISRPIVDPASRARMAYLESSPGSGAPVREGIEATVRGIDERAGTLAGGGQASERGAMGQRIQAAADRGHSQAGTAAGRVYDRADEAAEAAGAPRIYASETVRHLDENIARLQRNPKNNAAVIDYLQTVRADFADEGGNFLPKSIADIRDIRTSLSGEINRRNLSMTPAERIVNEAITAANADVARDFGTAAPQALRLYTRADRLWRARAETRKQIVERLIGPDDNRISGAQVMDRVAAMAKGDTPRLRRMWAMLTPEESLDTAATVAATAGRRAPDEAFSPAQLIAWSRGIAPSARQIMFGQEGAKSIENLNILSRALIDTRSALNNSRSGQVVNWGRALGTITGGGTVGTLLGGLPGTVAGAVAGAALSGAETGARYLSARSLMSPDMSRWLAAAPRMTSAASIRRHIGRLTTIAARDPAIAQEATGLQRTLLQAVNENAAAPMRAAAESDPSGGDNRQ